MTASELSRRLAQALDLHQRGSLAEAERLYCDVLKREPRNADALHFLGVLNAQRGDALAALSLIEQAIAAAPGNPVQLYNRGNALSALNRAEEALASYEAALKIAPDHVGSLTNRGAILQQLGRLDEALASFDRARALQPSNPAHPFNRANALRDLSRLDEAIASYGAALALDAKHSDALTNRGNILLRLRRYPEALADYDAALAARPEHAETLYNRGNLFLEQRRFDEALASYDAAIAASKEFAKAHKGRGNVYFELGRYEDAFAAYDAAFRIDPTLDYLEGCRVHLKMHLCDWTDLTSDLTRLYRHVDEGKHASEPFMLLPTHASAQAQLRCAQIFAADRHPSADPVWRGEVYGHRKIRLAYLSGEFREQAVAYVTADLFECHDRSDFEIHGLATGIDDASPMRKRIKAAFDVFTDVSNRSDRDVAELARHAEIDILINLNGYFGVDRTGVFAARASPVQVNYLGFPGTMGAPYMDYLIADRLVIPQGEQAHYSEKIAYLPECYQPNDRKRAIAGRSFARAELGLPETGFVFCCFSTSHKLNPETFDVWMRLLHQVDGSVLWLSGANAPARSNLKREAVQRGVDADRIVFAEFLPDSQDHLARLRAADLFLDSLPHNAHTTTTDALWSGVPVLTALGSTFPARVAASLLHAAGLNELVTASLPEYEALALSLARDPVRLSSIRARIAKNRDTCALFDTPRFARHIESAYRTMRERQRAGLPPASFAVAAD